MTDATTIPVVLMSGLLSAASEKQGAEARIKLLHAFETTGLAYLEFDGVHRVELDNTLGPAFRASRDFFSRPQEEKHVACAPVLPPGVTRGYLGMCAESGAGRRELKEAFSWSYPWKEGCRRTSNDFEARNVWPRGEGVHDMRHAYERLFDFFTRMAKVVCAGLSDGLGIDLGTVCEGGETISLARAFRYHPVPDNIEGGDDGEQGATGSCAHTDWGVATLVAQEVIEMDSKGEKGATAALQAKMNGRWVEVEAREGTLVVNCSDFVSLLTKGRLQSPLHRVVLTRQERLSFVFFQYPAYDAVVPDIPSSVAADAEIRRLSLLCDQTVSGDGGGWKHGKRFGEVVAAKWAEVQR